MTSVSVRDLSLNFGAVTVLDRLNLDIDHGEFLVLLGSSGCGKSTLLNCIAGLLDVSDGQIFIKDRNVTWEEPKDRGIGMVFQSYALYPQMTVEKNLSFGLKVAKIPPAEIEKRVKRASEILQIQPLLKRKPSELSGGQRQRVASAGRWCAMSTSSVRRAAVEPRRQTALRTAREIKRLHQSLKNTMIYVTHDQIEALTLADRIAVMKSGVIQQLADPMTIYNAPENLFVAGFIGSPSMNFFRGEVEAKDGRSFVRAGGIAFDVTAYPAHTRLQPGQKVVLGLRLEHVKVDEARDGEPTHQAVVDIEEPMGADNLLWLTFAGQSMSVRIAGQRRYPPGSTVRLSFDMGVASIFDAESENRL